MVLYESSYVYFSFSHVYRHYKIGLLVKDIAVYTPIYTLGAYCLRQSIEKIRVNHALLFVCQ